MSIDVKSLSHCKWECKYHIVWIPKYRRKRMYESIRQYLGEIFRSLARQKECNIVEGHVCVDHVHMLIEIPPKHSVAHVVWFIKGKSAIAIARRASLVSGKILPANTFGHAAISFQQLAAMKKRLDSTSSSRTRKISNWSN